MPECADKMSLRAKIGFTTASFWFIILIFQKKGMKNNLLSRPAVLVCLLLFSQLMDSCQSSRSASSSKMLRFNYENGKGYDYEMEMLFEQKILETPVKIGMNTYYSLDVEADDGTVKTLAARYERFRMDMDVVGMKLNVDTEKPEDTAGVAGDKLAMLGRVFRAVRGKSFTMKVDAEGKVLEVKGFREMTESIVSSLGLDPEKEKETREKLKQQFGQQFNDQKVREQFERFFYIFPAKEVKVGDSWEKSSQASGLYSGNLHSTYTVVEIEGDMVTLEEKTRITSENENGDIPGEQTGTLIVDSRNGLVVKAGLQLNMTIAGSIPVNIKTRIRGKAR